MKNYVTQEWAAVGFALNALLCMLVAFNFVLAADIRLAAFVASTSAISGVCALLLLRLAHLNRAAEWFRNQRGAA